MTILNPWGPSQNDGPKAASNIVNEQRTTALQHGNFVTAVLFAGLFLGAVGVTPAQAGGDEEFSRSRLRRAGTRRLSARRLPGADSPHIGRRHRRGYGWRSAADRRVRSRADRRAAAAEEAGQSSGEYAVDSQGASQYSRQRLAPGSRARRLEPRGRGLLSAKSHAADCRRQEPQDSSSTAWPIAGCRGMRRNGRSSSATHRSTGIRAAPIIGPQRDCRPKRVSRCRWKARPRRRTSPHAAARPI